MQGHLLPKMKPKSPLALLPPFCLAVAVASAAGWLSSAPPGRGLLRGRLRVQLQGCVLGQHLQGWSTTVLRSGLSFLSDISAPAQRRPAPASRSHLMLLSRFSITPGTPNSDTSSTLFTRSPVSSCSRTRPSPGRVGLPARTCRCEAAGGR